jgi:hypothetical protein
MSLTSDTSLRIIKDFVKAHMLYVGMFLFIIVLTYMTVRAKKVSDNWQKTNNEMVELKK